MDIINILIILILSQFDPYLSRMPTYTPSLLHVKNWTTADTKCQWKYDTWCRKCYKLRLRQFEDKMPTCVMKHTEFRKPIKWWAFTYIDLIIHSTIAYISCKHVNVATLNFFFFYNFLQWYGKNIHVMHVRTSTQGLHYAWKILSTIVDRCKSP